MRIIESKGICNCGKCGKEPIVFRLELLADSEQDYKALAGIMAHLRQEATAAGRSVITHTPISLEAITAKALAAKNN